MSGSIVKFPTVERSVATISASQDQRKLIADLVKACELLETHPERFPELYGKVKKRWPDRRVRKADALLMAAECRMMDSVDRRVGLPRRDGSVLGRSLAVLAIETGLGDPTKTRTYWDKRLGRWRNDWRGRRKILRRFERLHMVGFLEGGNPRDSERRSEQLVLSRRQTPRNPRWQIKKGPRAGSYVSYPTVRKIGMPFIERVRLDIRFKHDAEDVAAYRKGHLDHFIDVHARRARDRAIKARQREKAREQRIYYTEERQALAARTVKRTE
ncbi:MAG TPA: hypothetical protein VFJ64_10805 [Solirubrobacterales bacterium]|nr:hypothetical protein [Solirubrobacterales bacterium]